MSTKLQATRSEEGVVELGSNWKIPKPLFEAVRAAAIRTIPHLAVGLQFKAEHVCGPNFWLGLTSSDAKLAGRCLVHLVQQGEVPLAFAPRKGTCQRYQRL